MDWRNVGAIEEIPVGGMKRFDVEDREIAVARIETGIYAFDDRCPHMNAPLHQGKLERGQVVCPLHKTRFDLTTGERLSDPKIPLPRALKVGAMMADIRTYGLETYEVKEENGRILVNLERRRTA